MNRRWHSIAALTLLLFAISPHPANSADAVPIDLPLVVIGGVDSAAHTVSTLLEHLGLIDREGHWAGGETILIQTGDLIDGGDNVRATLDLFMRLQREAATAGGKVIVLLGNHEAMNILGELRSVNYMSYQTFIEPDSEERQRQAWEDWLAWRTRRAEALGEEFEVSDDAQAEWFAVHPPGWIEYAESMRSEGVYGSWLRSLPVAVEIDKVLFIHAGIGPGFHERDVATINQRAANEVKRFDECRSFMVQRGLALSTSSVCEMTAILKEEVQYLNSLGRDRRKSVKRRWADVQEIKEVGTTKGWLLLDDDGPLWYRGASKDSDEDLGPTMGSILDTFRVDRMVTGQSAGRERIIRTRYNNRVLLTSIDMTDDPYVRGGNPAALEIVGGDYFVVTLDSRKLLIDG